MNKALTIFLILATIHSYGQKNEEINLELEFQLLEKSNEGVKHTIEKKSVKDTSLVEYNTLINSVPGEINGPFEADSKIYYTKTLGIDSAYICHVGNIWISKSKGWEYAKKTANEILEKVNAGGNYDTFCKSFSDDGNKKPDCELPWSFASDYVEPFAKAIESHDKGEVFVVKTKYGYHVVKIIEQGKMEQKSVTYLKIQL